MQLPKGKLPGSASRAVSGLSPPGATPVPGYLSWVVQRLHVNSKYRDWPTLHVREHLMWSSLLPVTEMDTPCAAACS